MVQAGGAESAKGMKEAVTADARVAVGVLAKAEQCASEVLARLGQSHSMALLLEGQAAAVAAQLPEMQARPSLSPHRPYLCPFPVRLHRRRKQPHGRGSPTAWRCCWECHRPPLWPRCPRCKSSPSHNPASAIGCGEPSAALGPSKLYGRDCRHHSRGLNSVVAEACLFLLYN